MLPLGSPRVYRVLDHPGSQGPGSTNKNAFYYSSLCIRFSHQFFIKDDAKVFNFFSSGSVSLFDIQVSMLLGGFLFFFVKITSFVFCVYIQPSGFVLGLSAFFPRTSLSAYFPGTSLSAYFSLGPV